MRILLIAPLHRQLEYFSGRRSTPFLPSQGQQSWVAAMKNLGHQVLVFRSNDAEAVPARVGVYAGRTFEKFLPNIFGKYMNTSNKLYNFIPSNFIKNGKLFNKASKFKPDVIMLSGGTTEIFPSTIKRIKDTYNSKVLLMAGVNPNYAATVSERTLIKENVIDWVVENDRGYAAFWKKMGVKARVLPISSVNLKLHRKLKLSKEEIENLASDICFVGTLTLDRQEKLAKLTGLNLKIWGDIPSGAKIIENLKPYYYGEAFGEKMVKIFNAAKIVLNFQPKDMTHGGNMRTFEISGCGAFQLADRVDPNFLADGWEVILFKDIGDLTTKIKFYLNDQKEREIIARAGYNKVHVFHTYEKHFEKLFKEI